MSKNLPTKCYQEIKEILPEKAHKRYQNRSKKKMKSCNMVENISKISQKMKTKSLLSIEKDKIE